VFGIERRSKIISILHDKKSILVNETAALFHVTEETIRRDLKLLENQGLLTRTHGGAVLTDDTKVEASLEVREGINIEGKDAIGKKAAEEVSDGDTIILDASTTSLYVAKHIKDKKGITVITNAEKVAFTLSECKDITIISTGGILRHNSLSYVGRAAENALSNYYADKVFFSCKGFSPGRGMMDSNEEEAEIKKTMIKCSNRAIFLCDHTKFDKVGFTAATTLDDISMIITDKSMPEGWARQIGSSGIKIKTAAISAAE